MLKNSSAIILAAGLGTRLSPKLNGGPKCLVPVHGRPLLGHIIGTLLEKNVREIVVVVGHLHQQVRDYCESEFPDSSIKFSYNPAYASTGTAESVQCGLRDMTGQEDLILIEGDTLFEGAVLERLFADSGMGATALSRYRPDLSGTFALIDSNGKVKDWVHEKVRPLDFPLEKGYKTVNITRFSKAAISAYLLQSLKSAIEEYGRTSPFEHAARKCIREMGMSMDGVEVSDCKWYEVDTPEDLEAAERIFTPSLSSNGLPRK